MQQENEIYRRRLGRGISALLGGAAPAAQETAPATNLELRHIGVDQIERNPFQPRKDFDSDALTELAASIKEHGVLQPLLVRELDGGFQLVAGERRWQAAKKAGLTAVPCRVLDIIDKAACEVALEENLKRKDLTDLEKAAAFRRYIDHFQCTIEELAKQLSMSRPNVNNILRLLDLPEPVRAALQSGKISSGHARSILSLSELSDQLALCGRIQAEGLSVRQTETAVRQINKPQPAVETPAAQGEEVAAVPTESAGPETIPLPQAEFTDERTNHVHSLEEQLGALLGVKVEIRLKSKDAGTIVVPFASNDEFERILTRLRRAAA